MESDYELISDEDYGVLTPTTSDEESDIENTPNTSSRPGGHPPWRGHGDKLVGVVDMGR